MNNFIVTKRILLLASILFLCACSAKPEKTPAPVAPDPNTQRLMAEPKPVHRDDLFEMRLNIAKTNFHVDEPIEYSASLTYIGDRDSITIWGPRTYIVFSLTDGKKLTMPGLTTAELTQTKLIRGETRNFPFFKSGGYSANDPDAGFWKKFYSEKELLLPKGTYLISAKCVFSLTEKVTDSHYNGEVHTTITVE